MNRDRFSVATFNLYNLQLPGVAMNPGQKRCREAMERVLADPALNGKYDLLAEPANGRKIVCGARAQGPAARSAGLVERNDAQTPDVRVTTPHFSRPVLNFQVALREQPPLTEVFVAHLKSKLPERVYTSPRPRGPQRRPAQAHRQHPHRAAALPGRRVARRRRHGPVRSAGRWAPTSTAQRLVDVVAGPDSVTAHGAPSQDRPPSR